MQPEPTPIEQRGPYWFKRDDLFQVDGMGGGKVRSCLSLASKATQGLVTAGSRASPQINIVATIAKRLGLPCRAHAPTGELGPELREAQSKGTEIVQHRPGYNNVIVARARQDAKERGWTEIPFGMECQEAVEQTATQVTDLPPCSRIVIPLGSGMSASGLLTGLQAQGLTTPVLGVRVGAAPEGRLDKFAPPNWRDMMEVVTSPLPYETPAPQTTIEGIELDPHYEAKCIPYLKPGDLLWIVGIRQHTRPTMTQPEPMPTTETAPSPKTPVVRCAFTRMVPIDDMLRRKHPKNPNTHPAKQIRLLAKIFEATGIRAPWVVSNLSGLMTRGHGRLEAALLCGYTEIPVDFQDYESEAQELEDLIADNMVAELAAMDRTLLDGLLAELATNKRDPELAGILKQVEDIQTARKSAAGALKAKFIVSPFTILNTTGKDWQDRKALWLALGIASEVGRKDDLVYGSSSQPPHYYTEKEKFDAAQGRKTSWDEFFRFNPHLQRQANTSIFNPVVCEVFFNWFLPTTGSGAILDPFAGGSVRGIVAAFLGHAYTGIELRKEQIDANEANARDIFGSLNMQPKHWPRWIHGDSTKLADLLEPTARFDLIFTCPPYGDLEKYSDDPADLSAQPADQFAANYRGVIQAALGYLLPNRFSVWIVGDYRDKATGFQRGFPALTIEAHKPQAQLYNHAVLLTPANSLAIRVSSFFPKSRKLGRTHQDAIITYNGNAINLDAAAQAATTDVAIFYNGANDTTIKETLGPLNAREIVPLGDLLKTLTEPKT